MRRVKMTHRMGSLLLGEVAKDVYFTHSGMPFFPYNIIEPDDPIETIDTNKYVDIDEMRYEQLAGKYEVVNPLVVPDAETALQKHLTGKHDQAAHGKGGTKLSGASLSSDLTSAEKKSVADFGTGYHQVQNRARGKRNTYRGYGRMSDSQLDEMQGNLDSAISKSKLDSNVTLVREVPETTLPFTATGSGKGTIRDKGFLVMDKAMPLGGDDTPPYGSVKLKIQAKAGTTALPLRGLAEGSGNKTVFPRGTKIRITGKSENDFRTYLGEIVE